MTQGNYPAQGQPPAYGGAAGRGQSFGVVGAVLAVLGAVALIIAFTATKWFSGLGDAKFSDMHDLEKSVGDQSGVIADPYFSWLGWTLLIVAVVAAIAANLPTPASGALRGIGVLVGLAGIVLTFFSVKLADGVDFSDALKHARIAFYLALGGFLLATIGAAIGPRRT